MLLHPQALHNDPPCILHARYLDNQQILLEISSRNPSTLEKKIIFFLFFEFMQNFSSIFSLAYPPFLSSCLLLPVR